jgi:hypothetical protein
MPVRVRVRPGRPLHLPVGEPVPAMEPPSAPHCAPFRAGSAAAAGSVPPQRAAAVLVAAQAVLAAVAEVEAAEVEAVAEAVPLGVVAAVVVAAAGERDAAARLPVPGVVRQQARLALVRFARLRDWRGTISTTDSPARDGAATTAQAQSPPYVARCGRLATN